VRVCVYVCACCCVVCGCGGVCDGVGDTCMCVVRCKWYVEERERG